MLEDGERREFLTTQWALVAKAGVAETPGAAGALESLCRAYWHPLYAQVRRRGFSAEDSADLTQAFFQRLIQKKVLVRADQTRGRFRTFLLSSLVNFINDEVDRANAAKRGGRAEHIQFDPIEAEEFYSQELTVAGPAETEFDRAWAHSIMQRVRKRLREEAAANGRVALFDALLPVGMAAAPYELVAARLRMTEGAVKLAVFRMRQRYREAIREEVAQTVAAPGELDQELKYLLAVIAASPGA